jgi:U3 small nucleolar RNA-associated protein MPP10
MEDARPSAGGEVAGASQLAPQEVYRAGEGIKGAQGEVVGKSGLPSGKEEMSREERKRRRRREKERGRKNNDTANGVGESNKSSRKKEKEKQVLGDLKKGGVKVIGKKGDLRDVEGKVVRDGVDGGQFGGGRYKL